MQALNENIFKLFLSFQNRLTFPKENAIKAS